MTEHSDEHLLALLRNFIQEAKQVLPIKKIAKLHQVERKFKELVLKRAKAGNKKQ